MIREQRITSLKVQAIAATAGRLRAIASERFEIDQVGNDPLHRAASWRQALGVFKERSQIEAVDPSWQKAAGIHRSGKKIRESRTVEFEPTQQVAGILRLGAHRPGRDVQKMSRVHGPVGHTRTESTRTLDQEQSQRLLRLSQQLAGQQRSTEASAHDGDGGHCI